MKDSPDQPMRQVALAELRIDPLNCRQEVPEAEVAAMAESIRIAGLLQNLVGIDRGDHIGIVGGGKRLRALQRLEAEGAPHPAAVPVCIAPDEATAMAAALAENNERTAPHPADEVRHYRALHEGGAPVQTIAATCGVSELHVRRRLKLAHLPEPALEALRAGEITLEAAGALTMAASDEHCLAVLADIRGQSLHLGAIRRRILGEPVRATDARARFVGAEAYRAAGGEIAADLFQQEEWWTDTALLDEVADRAGDEAADRLRAQDGWAAVTFMRSGSLHWGEVDGMERLETIPGELGSADQAEYDRLAALYEGHAELDAQELDRLQALQDRLDGDGNYAEDEIAGATLYIGPGKAPGQITFLGAFRKPRRAESSGGDDPESETPAPKPIFPANLLDDLAAIRLHTLQVALLDKTELMLDLLAYGAKRHLSPWGRPLAVRFTDQRTEPAGADPGFTADPRLEPPEPGYGRPTAEDFEKFRAEGKAARNKLLTAALARATQAGDGMALVSTLIEGLSARRHWTPSAAFFKRVQRADWLDNLYFELTGLGRDTPEGKAFLKENKSGKATALGTLFESQDAREALGLSREQNARIDSWVPEALRFGEAE